jgi:hypothetical protein
MVMDLMMGPLEDVSAIFPSFIVQAISKMPNSPISARPAVLLKLSFSLKAAFSRTA